MQASDFGLARSLFPKATDVVASAFGGVLPSLQVPATAVTSSEDGSFLAVVEADFIADEDAIEDEDIDVPDGYSLIEVPSSANVNAGDSVLLTLQGNKALDAGSAGWGDRVNSVAAAAETLAQQAQAVASSAQQGATEASSLAAAASTAASSAQSTANNAASTASAASSAASAASAAAASAQSTADGVAETIPTLATKDELATIASDTGTTVITTPAATAPLVSLDVDGKSVQDGTPTPSAPVAIQSVAGANLVNTSKVSTNINQAIADYSDFTSVTMNGITWTNNGDGTVHASGTATAFSSIFLPLTEVVPTGSTVYVSGAPATGNSSSRWRQDVFSTSNTSVQSDYGQSGKRSPTTADANRLRLYIYSGASIDATFYPCVRTSLVGYSKSGSVSAAVTGKNLLWQMYVEPCADGYTVYGITWTSHADGSITASGTATLNSSVGFGYIGYLEAGTYKLSDGVGGSSSTRYTRVNVYDDFGGTIVKTFNSYDGAKPIAESGWYYISAFLMVMNGQTVDNLTFYPQLERGSTATDYEPYHGTTIPIDLQGHELRSLPDGTKDELNVDSAGNVTLVQRVYEWQMQDFSNKGWSKSGSATNGYYLPASQMTPVMATSTQAGSHDCILSNMATARSTTSEYFNQDASCYLDSSANFNLTASVVGSTLSDFKTWLATSDLTLVGPLATPQTIDLGTITMPTVEDGDTVEIVGSSVVPTIWAEWFTPTGAGAGEAATVVMAPAIAQVQAMAEETQAHFWSDSGGAHVGTVDGQAHASGAGYNMTLGATGTTVGILLDHDDETLASFTPSALNFYADGQVAAGYTKDGVALYAQDENDAAQQVATFTASGVTFFDGTGNDSENILATFGKDGAVIGAQGGTQVAITDQLVAFVDGGDVVASISGQELEISAATVTDRLSIGNFAWIPRSNGNLTLKWMGGTV